MPSLIVINLSMVFLHYPTSTVFFIFLQERKFHRCVLAISTFFDHVLNDNFLERQTGNYFVLALKFNKNQIKRSTTFLILPFWAFFGEEYCIVTSALFVPCGGC
jgi:hypothetical protein